MLHNSWDYLLDEERVGKTCDDFEENANTVIVLNTNWVLTLFAPKLCYTNSYYAMNFRDEVDQSLLAEVDKNDPCYLVVDRFAILDDDVSVEDIENDELLSGWAGIVKHEDEYLEQYKDLDEVEDVKRIGSQNMMGREFWIYEVVFSAK